MAHSSYSKLHIRFMVYNHSYLSKRVLSGSLCPTEISLQFDRKLSLETDRTVSNPAQEASVSGNCTNNLTVPVSLRRTTSPPEDSHPPIATFDEWTKEKLKQDHRKSPSPTSEIGLPSVGSQQVPPSTPAARNYASKECGAKVLHSNSEAENTKAILNEKEKDEYMRNPCENAANKFVIIELCETIQLRSIELANYELFSSGPRTIRLWSSERFPTGEWQLITELTAMDSRQIQQFPISSNGIYVKFMKVELLSHYGSEHYCTLSVLKVLGISMIDEYEAEAEAASVVHTRNNIRVVTDTKPNQTSVETVDPPTTSPLLPVQENGDSKASVVAPVSNDKKLESNPTVIETVNDASGSLIDKFVNVVGTNFGEGRMNPHCNDTRKYKVANPLIACYFCPKDGYYIYPVQFCRAFVWKMASDIKLQEEETRIPTKCRMAHLRRRFSRNCRAPLARNQPLSEYENVKISSDEHPQQQQPTPQTMHSIPSEAWPASSTTHKESVFMKLNKRIAALELNMSLSSEYLSELSRQYVAQNDEHQRRMRQAREIVDEAVEAIYARVNETLSSKIAQLRKEVDTLSYWLSSMRFTASKMTISQITRGAETTDHEECSHHQPTQLHRYSPPDDDLWTSEQVVYIVLSVQLVTVLLLSSLSFCYQRFLAEQHLSESQIVEVENLVNGKLSRSALQFCVTEQGATNHQCCMISGCMLKSHTAQHGRLNQERANTKGACLCRNKERGRENLIERCTSSSSTLMSDEESSSEEFHIPSEHCVIPSELPVISSIA
ncbi:hypothetical protein KIN20_036706 [Parelaphostrongylus tenuis]|uniref:SUN domain-containing protein n=1 Tax=Parelaphostrongylus tenuis TaxID=148309 RepID=A0AAD5WLF0_PARTN|nr:hypothetical protein KIN20_036706 [Parelaphostrongylus tenuis]